MTDTTVEATAVRTIPALTKPRTARLPKVEERTLASGLRILAVRRPTVPVVEVRLRLPFAGRGSTHLARADLLGESFFTGTAERSRHDLATALQHMGGRLGAGADADHLAVSGAALATELDGLLELLAELLTDNAYPSVEVRGERERLASSLEVALSQPSTRASEALLARLYGTHPYGREVPSVEEVESVTPAALRTLHRKAVGPTGAVLVLVGDLRPAKALDAAEAALGVWSSEAAAGEVRRLPRHDPGPALLVDRPGSVQTTIRMGGPALRRTDELAPALKLANLVFGGYFSSRLVANIRERRGYTYSPRSSIHHARAGSRLTVSADVATEVTAAAMVEIDYELGRMATQPVTADELDAARRYAIGSLQLSTATQAGLASTLTQLAVDGLDIGYLRDHPAALQRVTVDDVAAVSQHFAPRELAAVLLGDGARTVVALGGQRELEIG